MNETKNVHVPATDLIGFEFDHVLLVTDEAEQAIAIAKEQYMNE